MRSNTKEMETKVETIFNEAFPVSAKYLSKQCNLSQSSIYKIIRNMREKGKGIIATKKGYLLAKHASKKDDVSFLRKINGRRTSDYVALSAALPDIEKRWKGIEHNELKSICAPLLVNKKSLINSLSIIKVKSERLGL